VFVNRKANGIEQKNTPGTIGLQYLLYAEQVESVSTRHANRQAT